MTPFVRAEELARVIALLPDPENTAAPRIEMRVERIRHSIFDVLPKEEPVTMPRDDVVVFRREVFRRGRKKWHEWVLDLDGPASKARSPS